VTAQHEDLCLRALEWADGLDIEHEGRRKVDYMVREIELEREPGEHDDPRRVTDLALTLGRLVPSASEISPALALAADVS
jgi:hypothetical protein